jgi:hypothetical protein
MDSSVSPKDEIWFLRVCHHISKAVYDQGSGWVGRSSVAARAAKSKGRKNESFNSENLFFSYQQILNYCKERKFHEQLRFFKVRNFCQWRPLSLFAPCFYKTSLRHWARLLLLIIKHAMKTQ